MRRMSRDMHRFGFTLPGPIPPRVASRSCEVPVAFKVDLVGVTR